MLNITAITTNTASTSARAYVCEYIEECQQEHEDIVVEGLKLANELSHLCWQCYELGSSGWRYSWR